MDVLDMLLNIYENSDDSRVFDTKFQKLDSLYLKGETLFEKGLYRDAKEYFSLAEKEGAKVYKSLYKDSPFLKRCVKRQKDCIDNLVE